MTPSFLHLEPSVLEWALQRARDMHVHPKAIELLDAWHRGTALPTFNEINEVAHLTGIRESDFYLSAPPELDCELIRMRTCDTPETETASRNLADMHQYNLQALDFCREHMPEPAFSLSDCPAIRGKSAEAAADAVREFFSLPLDFVTQWKDPVYALARTRKALSARGIQVHIHDGFCAEYPYLLPVSECRSYSYASEPHPFIYVNANDMYRGQLYALLFSLIQLLCGRTRLFNDPLSREELTDEADRFCEDVTECLLMPTRIFADSWASIQEKFPRKMALLEDRYMISPYAFLRRAAALGEIAPDRLQTMKNMTMSTWTPGKENLVIRASIWAEMVALPWDVRFLLAADHAVSQGQLTAEAAYRLTHTSRLTYGKTMDRARRISVFQPDAPKTQKHGSTLEILGPICIIDRKPDERKNRT